MVRKCPVCGNELNLLEGGQEGGYAWETMECLKCNLAILVHYEQNETVISLSARISDPQLRYNPVGEAIEFFMGGRKCQ